MPYKSIEELPDKVKKKLNPKQQQQWMNIFNSVLAKTKDEGEANKQAWGAMKKFELQLEIFSEGVWNGEEFKAKHLEDIITAFYELKSEFLPRIKLGHQDNQVDVALGMIDSVWKKGSKLMANIVDMPKIVYDAIKSKLFKGVSIELMLDYKSSQGVKYPMVLDAAAILGSTLPAVKDLDDLTAYMGHKGNFKLIRTYSQKTVIRKDKTTMVDIDQKELDKLKMQANKANELQVTVDQMKKDQQESEEKQLKAKFENEVKAFKDFCNEKVEKKVLTPANRDLFFKQIDAKTFKGESSIEEIKTLRVFVDNQIKVFEENSNTQNDSNNDNQSDDPADEVHKRVRKYCIENPQVSYEDAVTVVLMEDGDLAKRYTNRIYE